MERRWKVLIVTSVAVFIGFLDVTVVNVAFPDVERSFPGDSVAGLSWILNAYNIVFAALLVPAGRVADLVGRRRMFFVGLGTFLTASALCAAAPSVAALVAARIVQAAGAAVLVPTSLGLLLPEFPLKMRATATSLWGATGAIAAAAGPSIGGVLVDAAGWRWVFLVNLPIGLAAWLPARRLLREIRGQAGDALPDVVGVLLLIAGVGLLALGIVEGPDWGWGSPRVIGVLAGGVVLLAGLVRRSRRHAAPVVEPALFRVRSFAVASSASALFSMAFYALLLCNILFLTGVWHYSILEAGFGVTPGPLTAALAAALGGRLSDRFGQRIVAVPGALTFALGCGLLAAGLDATPDYAGSFLPATVLTGAGVGLTFSSLSSAAVAELPPARFATGSAVFSCARQLGAVLGVSVLVAVIGTPSPAEALDVFREAYGLMVVGGAASAVTAIGLGRVRARDPGIVVGAVRPESERAAA
jgi:EmrB/QacA subfamily drug resistance transporter